MDIDFIRQFLFDFIDIINKMSPYLLLGFFFAGLLKVFLPQKFIDKHLSGSGMKSVFLSALIGVPMPLCSCGVIPTGVSLYKNGASKGATVSFLISTPQTGVDSILVTYSLLGLPFAIIRPFIALLTGVFGGVITHNSDSGGVKVEESNSSCNLSGCNESSAKQSKIRTMLKYAFVDFLQDISKWLIIGMILAAVISVLIPNGFFEQFIGNRWLEMGIILLVAIPLYVCATGSVPIVAALMLKGLSPGAALVFLMAGPATNAATITVLRKSIGTKATWTYLFAIIFGAVIFGLMINYFLPVEWFSLTNIQHLHAHNFMPKWLEWGSSILLLLLIINGYFQKKRSHKLKKTNSMNEKQITVNGMNCNHCKNSVEKNLSQIEGISSVKVDLEQKTALIEGVNINLDTIKNEIEKLGFDYGGEND